jgi:Protein of Unknown function (DUF2784)
MNIYEILADATVAVHLAYMGYVLIGQLVIMIGWPLRWGWIRNPWFRLSHLAMISIVAFEAVMGWRCPLTTLEEHLRAEGGQEIADVWKDGHHYTGEVEGISFTGRVLRRIQFAGDLCPDNVSTIFYVTAGIIVATAILVPPRFRKKPAQPPSSPPAEVSLKSDAHEAVRRADNA